MAKGNGTGSGRGRPRKYLDDADRAQAYRERVADDLARLQMLDTIFDRPTPALIRRLAARYIDLTEDKASGAAKIVEALLSGIADGGGLNAMTAGLNFARDDFKGPSDLKVRVLTDQDRAKALVAVAAAMAGG